MTPELTGTASDTQEDRSDTNYRVPALERGLRILTEFSLREPVLGVSELSKRLGIPRTTVFRLLQTLEAHGFVERTDTDRNCRPGVAALRLGLEYLGSLELTELGQPLIDQLRDDTGFTAHILVRDERDVVFVAKAQSHAAPFSSVRVSIGTRLPAHASTHGHVLLGDLDADELHALYPERTLKRYTQHTPATVDALHALVLANARRGFAIGQSSFESGISVVTAPVRDATGRIAAVVTTTILSPQLAPALFESNLVDKVRFTADQLTQRLNDGRVPGSRGASSSARHDFVRTHE
ncbi:IclR family transcriptional regulator [Paraburkholderia sp. Cy-641]|uniref:IclR family transcriptional regulator n=1 Tax=Paraburkholderia sp. Cy-641 TaxID=2608337 RepID=UPI0014218F87|nr:IclR family transcriptional regulator [Paraburkholderia sp. Cy-641]NIF78758.1 IclR family transcriptional regulator [Paraburkholderia sp. Cy-641]